MAHYQGYGDSPNYQFQKGGQYDGRLHYLKDAENGLNTEHHKDFANN